MPNHETNSVVIIGPPANIRRFVDEALIDYPIDALGTGETAESKPAKIIDFARIIPEPDGIERGGCSGQHAPGVVCWHEWNTQNWGTKWGAYSHSHYGLRWLQSYAEAAEIYGRVDLRFETAWSQPTPVFEAIEKRWGVAVHAITQDEGGFPDVLYGSPIEKELLFEVRTFDFESWHRLVEEPSTEVTA